jgi:hypothetical protein
VANNGNGSRGEGSADQQWETLTSSKRSTGPRTPTGKNRSKRNAIRHGLSAEVIVVSHESQSDFDDLVRGLRRYYKPESLLEEELVRTIAAILWRRRRLLRAERECIQQSIDNQQVDELEQSLEDLRDEGIVEERTAESIYNDPDRLASCLNRLEEVLEKVELHGLDHDAIAVNLELVYGARDPGRPDQDLFDYYLECRHVMKSTEAERRAKGFESQVDCEREFTAATEKEIGRIERRLESEAKPPSHAGETVPMLMDMLIPDEENMNRLLRYAAHLDRQLDRALDQLERAQGRRECQRAIIVSNSLDGQIHKT